MARKQSRTVDNGDGTASLVERKTWDSYEDYLKSDEWALIRKKVRERDVVCQVCHDDGAYMECHHWRYPKDWNDDHPLNVFLVCKDCHEMIHSLNIERRDVFLSYYKSLNEFSELTLLDSIIDIAIANGLEINSILTLYDGSTDRVDKSRCFMIGKSEMCLSMGLKILDRLKARFEG